MCSIQADDERSYANPYYPMCGDDLATWRASNEDLSERGLSARSPESEGAPTLGAAETKRPRST